MGEQEVIKSYPQILRDRADIDRGPLSRKEVAALGGGGVALTALGVALHATGVAALATIGTALIAAAAIGVVAYVGFKLVRHAIRVRRHYQESLDTIETDMREPGMKRVN